MGGEEREGERRVWEEKKREDRGRKIRGWKGRGRNGRGGKEKRRDGEERKGVERGGEGKKGEGKKGWGNKGEGKKEEKRGGDCCWETEGWGGAGTHPLTQQCQILINCFIPSAQATRGDLYTTIPHLTAHQLFYTRTRPGVAGAGLQTASLLFNSFINSLGHPFPPNHQDIINPKPLELGS